MKTPILHLLAALLFIPLAQAGATPESHGFLSNAGQWPSEVHFWAQIAGARVWVLDDGFVVDRSEPCTGERAVFRIRFEGDGGPGEAKGENPRAAKHSSLLSGSWQISSAFDRVLLQGIQLGVDIRLRIADGHLEYDLLVEPGARPESVVIRLEGARLEGHEADGALRLRDPLGQVCLQSAPQSFVLDGTSWSATPSEVCVLSETEFTLRTPERPAGAALIVDPGLAWSTFLGSADDDRAVAVAVASDGDIVVVGDTASFDFPTTTGVLQPTSLGGGDVFVSRLSADGSSLRWSTFLGGSSSDSASDVHLDENGDVVVCGTTFSADYPTTAGAYRPNFTGVASAFVSRLDGTGGQTLLGSTFVGGTGFDLGLASAVTPAASTNFPGSVVVVGSTNGGFPVTPQVWQFSFAGGPSFGVDGFVARLSSDLTSAHFSTYLGASGGSESCRDVAVREDGRVIVTGTTDAPNFSAPGGAQTSPGGGTDGFIFELSADGRQRVAATLFGGSDEDNLVQLALTSAGDVVAAGDTRSGNLPQGTANPGFQSPLTGERDVFVARWSSDLSALQWRSRLGGLEDDEALGLVLAENEEPIVVGGTRSRQFPITPWGFDRSFNGPFPILGFEGDAFASRLSADGSQLEYGTFLGGSLNDQASGVALATDGSMVLAGVTNSFQFPTTIGAFDTVPDGNGLGDGWTLRLDFSRFPFVVGAGKLTSVGNQPLSFPSGFPSVSEGNFSVSVDGAEPNSGFTLLLASQNLVERPFFGGTRYVGHPIRRVGSSPLGFFGTAVIPAPGDASMIGQTWRYQFWFQDPNDAFGVGLSDAVEVTYVP